MIHIPRLTFGVGPVRFPTFLFSYPDSYAVYYVANRFLIFLYFWAKKQNKNIIHHIDIF